jgi:hypothetical protein
MMAIHQKITGYQEKEENADIIIIYVHLETSLQIRSDFHDLAKGKKKEEHTLRCFEERSNNALLFLSKKLGRHDWATRVTASMLAQIRLHMSSSFSS